MHKIVSSTLITLLFVGLVSCFGDGQDELYSGNPVSHKAFDELLKKHVSDNGAVSYKGFKADREKLKSYLDLLSANHPNDSWGKNERKAYWINVYNAFTIELILRHYPVESIKDIGSKIQIPFINSPWDIKLINIEGKEYDLNNVEHSVLRKEFNDPRIHFAIVCASYSCPRLLNEAYTADKLEAQLELQARNFINDSRKNKISTNEVQLSQIFNWFKGDFKDTGKNIIAYINQYAKLKVAADTKINYLEYDWSLNE